MSNNIERKGILSCGNWIIDHVKIVDRFPAQDTLANILTQTRGTGGSPYNVLIDLVKLGASFPLAGVGLVGDDEDGRSILNDCKTFGIDSSQITTTKEASTSYTDVMTVQSTGRRTFFHMRGANSYLNETHIDLKASNTKILLLGYLLLLDSLDKIAEDGTTGASRLLKQGQELGFKTAADVVSEDSDRFTAVVNPALPYIDYLIINEFEASKITGLKLDNNNKIDFVRVSEAAQKIINKGVREWVIIHCPEGVLARHRNGEQALQGSVLVPKEKIAGTAGAGDAFMAGVLLGLYDEKSIDDCLRLAVCTAASNLFDSTCTGGIKKIGKCLELGNEFGFREIC